MTNMEEKLPKLADGSRWAGETAVNVDGTEVSVDDRRAMFCDRYGESTVDVTDTLAVIDRANLDPVRAAARELYDSIASNDEGQDFSKETMALFKKLGEML
jgi:hypothetical protein